MNTLASGSALATVLAAASAFLVLAVLTVAGIVLGAAGYGCW